MDTIMSSPATLSEIDKKGSIIKSWKLEGYKSYKIGRSKDNFIVLKKSWVSRQHAMLQVEENGAFNAVDLGSANGTFVNGNRIFTPTTLRSGDLVKIGSKTTYTFLQDYTTPKETRIEDMDEKTVALLNKEEVTILICDIRQFTSLSEKVGDNKISDLLQIWTHKTNQTVSHFNGNIDKFIGDAAMATWIGGASTRHNVHMALSCAIKIAEMTTKLGNSIEDLPWSLAIGAALNTGEAVVGNIGVDGNRDNTVIGDVVNVAFRLEGLTSKIDKDLLVGNGAAQHLDQDLTASYFEECKYMVKGKEEPVIAHGCNFDQLKKYLSKA